MVSGVDLARVRRPGSADRDLARGPARLCAALAIDRSVYGTNLLDGSGPALLSTGDGPQGTVACGPRVGVTGGHDTPWRYWLDGEPSVSAYRRHVPRNRRAPAIRDGGQSPA